LNKARIFTPNHKQISKISLNILKNEKQSGLQTALLGKKVPTAG
jgi:hypothetical protein